MAQIARERRSKLTRAELEAVYERFFLDEASIKQVAQEFSIHESSSADLRAGRSHAKQWHEYQKKLKHKKLLREVRELSARLTKVVGDLEALDAAD